MNIKQSQSGPSAVQGGFTLIELVMVIVILGVLAAVALPKFVNVDDDAKVAAVSGVAGALSSASAINYASRKANSTKGVAVAKCSDVVAALQGGTLPSGYSVTTDSSAAADVTVSTCVLTGNGKTANFTVTGIT